MDCQIAVSAGGFVTLSISQPANFKLSLLSNRLRMRPRIRRCGFPGIVDSTVPVSPIMVHHEMTADFLMSQPSAMPGSVAMNRPQQGFPPILDKRGAPHVRRFDEQRWLIDNIIRANGIDWDQPRSLYIHLPCGIEANAD